MSGNDPTIVDLKSSMRHPSTAARTQEEVVARYPSYLMENKSSVSEYWYKRGLSHYMSCRFEAGVNALNIALLYEPEMAEAHFLKGVCLQLAALEEGEKGADFPIAVPPRARSLFMRAKWSFTACIRLNPSDEEARFHIAGIEALLA